MHQLQIRYLIIPSAPIHLRDVWPELRRFWYAKQLSVIESEHSQMTDVDIFNLDPTCNVIGDIEIKKNYASLDKFARTVQRRLHIKNRPSSFGDRL